MNLTTGSRVTLNEYVTISLVGKTGTITGQRQSAIGEGQLYTVELDDGQKLDCPADCLACECGAPMVPLKTGGTICQATADKYAAKHGTTITAESAAAKLTAHRYDLSSLTTDERAALSCPQIDRLEQIAHVEAARPYGKAAVERAEMEIRQSLTK